MTDWNWHSVLGVAQDLTAKAQILAENARKEATVLVKQIGENIQNYDLEAAKKSILSTTDQGLGDLLPTGVTSSLHSLDFVYVTENIVSMAFPCDFKKSTQIEGANDIRTVSRLLNRKHAGRYMIWNISEETYDYSLFDNQVLAHKFPGHPAPPLRLLFTICKSIESWLDADERNIAVIHCLTGKGRTAALISCVLTWIGEFASPMEALQYVADRKSISIDVLTIPSQRRYIQYFSNMLDGIKPRSEPLLLRRVIMNSVPIFDTVINEDGSVGSGCCPYVQLFKSGRLIATAAPPATQVKDSDISGSSSCTQKKSNLKLKWASHEEGSLPFQVDCALQGDILLRLRHVSPNGTRVSMLRAAFHTGYVPLGVLRFYKAQLDGASDDDRYDDDFFIDLIFAPIEKPTLDNHLTSGSNNNTANQGDSVMAVGVPSDSGLTIAHYSTEEYEQSIHRDTQFWDSIASRKMKAKKRKSRKFLSDNHEQFSISEGEMKSNDSPHPLMESDNDGNTLELSFNKREDKSSLINKHGYQERVLKSFAELSDEELILQLSGIDEANAKALELEEESSISLERAHHQTLVDQVNDNNSETAPHSPPPPTGPFTSILTGPMDVTAPFKPSVGASVDIPGGEETQQSEEVEQSEDDSIEDLLTKTITHSFENSSSVNLLHVNDSVDRCHNNLLEVNTTPDTLLDINSSPDTLDVNTYTPDVNTSSAMLLDVSIFSDTLFGTNTDTLYDVMNTSTPALLPSKYIDDTSASALAARTELGDDIIVPNLHIVNDDIVAAEPVSANDYNDTTTAASLNVEPSDVLSGDTPIDTLNEHQHSGTPLSLNDLMVAPLVVANDDLVCAVAPLNVAKDDTPTALIPVSGVDSGSDESSNEYVHVKSSNEYAHFEGNAPLPDHFKVELASPRDAPTQTDAALKIVQTPTILDEEIFDLPPAASAASAPINDDDDDDLAEMERFLESLAANRT